MGNECITKAKDHKAAIRNFDKALKLDPKFVDAWVRKGITLLDLREDHAAQACLNEAIRLSPNSFKARYNRGKCHLSLRNYDEAANDLGKAIDIKPQHAAAHDYLSEAYRHLGEEDLAQRHQDIAEEIRNKNQTNKNI